VSKQRSILITRIGCILLLGTFVLLMPVRVMEPVCQAQAQSRDRATSRTAVKPGQQPPASPGLSPPPIQSQSLSAQTSLRGQYTLNFDDADVYTIIQTIFGEILKANYIVDPRVKGRVTFRAVAPIPAENILPLMEVILRLNGIGIVEESGLYRIVPISDIPKEPSPISYGRDPATIQMTGKALLQVVPIIYLQSSDAVKLIAPFASQNAVLIDVPKGNQIIIVDTDANVRRLLKLIEVFDNDKLKQRKQQIFVYQVQNGAAKDIASILQQIFTGGKGDTTSAAPAPSKTGAGSPSPATPMSASIPSAAPGSAQPQVTTIPGGGEALVADPVKIIADDITNTIVILSTPEDYSAIVKAIEQIDIVPRQVVIEGMIASVSLGDNLDLGVARLFKQSYSGFNISLGSSPGNLNIDPSKLSQTGFTFAATDPAGAVIGLITALASDSKAKVLASPHILVSDNREAKIQVGQQVPLLTSETYGAVGVTPQRNYQYKDIGIILKVKPRINEGGLVSLEISQEISTSEKITLGGTEQLLLNKTEASTKLVVQDGQTIVIGGLIREDTNKSGEGIPFLYRIPIIGWLFGGLHDDTKRQELIILLTPRVIKTQKDAKNLSSEFIDRISESTQGRIKQEELIKGKPLRIPEGAKPPEVPGKNIPQEPLQQP
jgi:type II secretory pathway component GspD/PulD (secretin)